MLLLWLPCLLPNALFCYSFEYVVPSTTIWDIISHRLSPFTFGTTYNMWYQRNIASHDDTVFWRNNNNWIICLRARPSSTYTVYTIRLCTHRAHFEWMSVDFLGASVACGFPFTAFRTPIVLQRPTNNKINNWTMRCAHALHSGNRLRFPWNQYPEKLK